MLKKDVEVGKTYIVKVSNKEQPVTLVEKSKRGGWTGKNENTGRIIHIRTAGKLRREA